MAHPPHIYGEYDDEDNICSLMRYGDHSNYIIECGPNIALMKLTVKKIETCSVDKTTGYNWIYIICKNSEDAEYASIENISINKLHASILLQHNIELFAICVKFGSDIIIKRPKKLFCYYTKEEIEKDVSNGTIDTTRCDSAGIIYAYRMFEDEAFRKPPPTYKMMGIRDYKIRRKMARLQYTKS